MPGESTERLPPGTLHLLVLRVLAAGSMHGYGISQRLAELSGDWLQLEEGSLYPCLYRMESRGWIESKAGLSENNRRARYYSLTEAGRRQLRTEKQNWRRFSDVVENVLEEA
ncbi:MAG TPA: PadR family transcriptional regulator [Bryobacteraceae bacterium]